MDRLGGKIPFEGYRIYWPDGRPVAVGLDAFCTRGQRLLGLGRHLNGRLERLIRLTCIPLRGPDDNLNRIPGHRVRRLFIERRGSTGRLHFLDGTPTTIVFDLDRDEREVLDWVGLTGLNDGERMWFDLAAGPAGLADSPGGGSAAIDEQWPAVAVQAPRAIPGDGLPA
jgi:hypothetical protein